MPGRSGDVDVGGAGDGGLARVDRRSAWRPGRGPPRSTGSSPGSTRRRWSRRSACTSVRGCRTNGLAARSMPNASLLAAGRADHAEPAVVVDVPGAPAPPGRTCPPGTSSRWTGWRPPSRRRRRRCRRSAGCAGSRATVRSRASSQRDLAAASSSRGRRISGCGEPVRVVDLLVGVDALGAEPHPVDVVVAGLDAEHLAVAVHAQVHPALDAAEAAVGGRPASRRSGRRATGRPGCRPRRGRRGSRAARARGRAG